MVYCVSVVHNIKLAVELLSDIFHLQVWDQEKGI